METIFTVAAETKAKMEQLSTSELGVILMGYGMAIAGMTRTDMIDEIVGLEVYAFTH